VAEPLVALGRWDEATDVIEHALALSPPQVNRVGLRLLAAAIALYRGDLAAARALLAAARTALGRAGNLPGETQFYLPLAQLEAEQCLAEGSQAGALDVVAAAVDRFDLLRDPRYGWPLLTTAARACTTLPAAALRDQGAAERAGVLLGQLRTLAAKMDISGPVRQASRLTFAAEAGADPPNTSSAKETLARWDAAAAAWDRVAQPYQLATATLRAAEAAMVTGDRAGAAQRLRRAADLADQLGARLLSEEIAALARNARLALGAGHDASPAPPGLGLTGREFEVLRLVTAGRSNPEIGAELFISAKTASVHVSSILAKLGVSSRGEAAAAAHRLHLFDPAPAA
jgi:ATP/maltotriose-dependent transcriptional regulator MalT